MGGHIFPSRVLEFDILDNDFPELFKCVANSKNLRQLSLIDKLPHDRSLSI